MLVSILAHAESMGPGSAYLILLTVSGCVFLAMNLMSFGGEGSDGIDIQDSADGLEDGVDESGEIEAGSRSIFHYLSFRNCLNYLMGFGAGGYFATLSGAHPAVAALCALSGGGVCAILLYIFMSALHAMGETQPLRKNDALHASARVYIEIGPERSRRGKILVQLKGSQREFHAITDHNAALPRQSMVRIAKVEGDVFVVEPLSD